MPPVVATLSLHCSRPMPTTTHPDAWPPERLDRLARALLPVLFPDRAAPAPAAAFPSGAAQLQQIGLNC
jgi:hypothetical protein